MQAIYSTVFTHAHLTASRKDCDVMVLQTCSYFFSKRIALYAIKLGVPQPQLRLSRAKNQWGSCDSRGIVHLNWQLIQMPPHLIDYVVSHELSHLIEMNHSRAFWKIVESIYPNYLAARLELKSIG